jgi:hypothetical protein
MMVEFQQATLKQSTMVATNLLITDIVHLKGNQLHLHAQIIYTYIAHIVYIFLHLFTW